MGDSSLESQVELTETLDFIFIITNKKWLDPPKKQPPNSHDGTNTN